MKDKSGPEQIDDIIKLYGGWKAKNIAHLRTIINAAYPDVVEEVKWRMRTRPEGLPVWSHDGILCIFETFKDNQKLVFFKGALMKDLQQHFNARLKSSTDRAIELHEGDKIDETVIKILIAEAVRLNEEKADKK